MGGGLGNIMRYCLQIPFALSAHHQSTPHTTHKHHPHLAFLINRAFLAYECVEILAVLCCVLRELGRPAIVVRLFWATVAARGGNGRQSCVPCVCRKLWELICGFVRAYCIVCVCGCWQTKNTILSSRDIISYIVVCVEPAERRVFLGLNTFRHNNFLDTAWFIFFK